MQLISQSDERILEQLKNHPGSAGRMFEFMKRSRNNVTINEKPF